MLISYVWPEPQSSAAGLRDLNLIEGFRQQGYEVVIASAAENDRGRSVCESWAKSKEGVFVHSIRLNDSSFNQWIARLQPSLVVFDRFVTEEQFGWRVRGASPESLLVLDTQDLHCLRVSREKNLREQLRMQSWTEVDPSVPRVWDEDLVCRELASLHRVDLAWILSDFELLILKNVFGVSEQRIQVSRFAYPMHRPIYYSQGFEERQDFVMVGNFRHAPNLDAWRWLRAEVWPRIRAELPGVNLHVFGAYPPREVMEADEPSKGFHVHGTAADLSEVFQGRRVSLAPLRFGAGIKGKVTDSWWHGVPVVGTSIAAEGMRSPSKDWGGLIANDTAGLARACVELYADSQSWHRAQENGLTLLNELFSEREFASGISGSLERVRQNRARSSLDWTRRMLLQSSLDSYRYFGKWLELKSATGKKA